jgi:acyl-CoA reductase-like NAD-dependent aldehyde dehydrogenase
VGSERFELWIDGCATAAEGAALADVMEPATGELLAQVAQATVADAQRAADAAQRAFRSGPWARTRAVERAKALRVLAARIREQAKPLATLEARNAGKPIADAEWEIEAAAQCFEFFAGAATTLSGRVPPVDGSGLSVVLRLPVPDRRLEGGAGPGGR